jgi:hypothetical protein
MVRFAFEPPLFKEATNEKLVSFLVAATYEQRGVCRTGLQTQASSCALEIVPAEKRVTKEGVQLHN